MVIVIPSKNGFSHSYYKSSRLKVFCEKGVIKDSTKFTGKHLCWSLFFNKVADLRLATLLKKRLQRCFSVNFAKTTFFTEHLRWLQQTNVGSKYSSYHFAMSQKIKKRLLHRYFPVNFANFFLTNLFYRTPPVDCF